MKLCTFGIITLTLLIMSCSSKQEVDLVVTNAKIYTVDSAFTIHTSMAIANGRIVALGTETEIVSQFKSVNSLNLKGASVYPGFFDPHCHFLNYGLSLANAQLAGAKSWAETVQILVNHHSTFPNAWVLGRGWNQNEWDIKEFPTRKELDEAFPHTPVLITRIDGHAALANTVALKVAGVTEGTTVSGGEVKVDNGKPTGLLIDNALDLVRKHIPDYTRAEKENALNRAQQNCFAVGLTSVGDAGLELADVQLIDSMQQSGALAMKVNAMLNPSKENFAHFVDRGIYSTPRLTVRTIKLFADGALGSRGALLLEPYSDDPKNRGLQLETEERLTEVCQRAYDSGYQVAIHCIGDAAVRLTLNVYAKFLKPQNDLRWRIEHAQTVHPHDLNRFGQLAVVPSIQTTHATSDMFWAVNRLGKRIETAYIYKKLLEQNGWLPNGSDFPIEHINPIYGFYAGVARKNLDGKPEEGFQMEDALTREQALRAMTIWAARVAFEEEHKGSLEVGKCADFVVLDTDIMTVHESLLPKARVLKTFIDGKMVYSKN